MQNLCTYTVGVLEHGIKEDVARINILAGDHAEDVEVLGTVRERQFYLHAVIIGIGEDAVLRKFVQAEGNKACFYCRGAAKFIDTYSIEDPFFSAACFPFIVSIIK